MTFGKSLFHLADFTLCSARISVANLSSEVATSASAAIYSAWRSRCRVCVEIGAGLVPSLRQTNSSTNGSMLA